MAPSVSSLGRPSWWHDDMADGITERGWKKEIPWPERQPDNWGVRAAFSQQLTLKGKNKSPS